MQLGCVSGPTRSVNGTGTAAMTASLQDGAHITQLEYKGERPQWNIFTAKLIVKKHQADLADLSERASSGWEPAHMHKGSGGVSGLLSVEEETPPLEQDAIKRYWWSHDPTVLQTYKKKK